jgi:hypothetical protein
MVVSQLMPQAPSFLVWLGGMVIAVVTWRRHPMVSLLALLSLALFFVLSVGGAFLFVWLVTRPVGDIERASLLSAVGLIRGALAAAGWVVLLVAVFGWRRPPVSVPPTPPFEEEATDEPPHPGIQKGRSWGNG